MVSNVKRAGGKNKFRGAKDDAQASSNTEVDQTNQLIENMNEEFAEDNVVAVVAEDTQPEAVAEYVGDVVEATDVVEVAAEFTPEVTFTDVIENEFKLTSPNAPVARASRAHPAVIETTLTTARPIITSASCVRALEKAQGFGKSMLYLEVAVALAVFSSSSTGADLATKREVADVYRKAGYDTDRNGSDYKTVRRRISASADLFNKIGRESIIEAMYGLREGKAIDALCVHLGDTYRFDSIHAVLEFVGKPVLQTNTPEARKARAEKMLKEDLAAATDIDSRITARRAERQKQLTEESDGILVFSGPLSTVLPRDCTPSDIRVLIAKLSEFADRLEAEIGTPEEQRNREMHS